MIEVICDERLTLPYIHIPEINANFMIVTGSILSFLGPKKANEYSSQIHQESFEVVNTHANSKLMIFTYFYRRHSEVRNCTN